jgi:hypothetical protein
MKRSVEIAGAFEEIIQSRKNAATEAAALN